MKFDPIKGRTLIRSIQLFLMEAKSLLKFTVTKDERKVLMTRVVFQLPEDMQYLYGQIQCGRVSSLAQVLVALNKKEKAYGRSVSRKERHRLCKQARDRIFKWESGILELSPINETEMLGESSDSSISDTAYTQQIKKSTSYKDEEKGVRYN